MPYILSFRNNFSVDLERASEFILKFVKNIRKDITDVISTFREINAEIFTQAFSYYFSSFSSSVSGFEQQQPILFSRTLDRTNAHRRSCH